MRPPVLACLALLTACDGCFGPGPFLPPDSGLDTGGDGSWEWAVGPKAHATARALAVGPGSAVYIATDAGIVDPWVTGAALPATGLPEGTITWLAAPAEDVVLAFVHGAGFFRSVDGAQTFAAVSAPPNQPLATSFNPRAVPVPQGYDVGDDGVIWLAALGGIFTSADQGDTWELQSLATSGKLNLLFTDLDVEGERVVAVAQLADSMLPAAYEGLLSGVVFESEDGGATWEEVGEAAPFKAPMGVAIAEDGTLYVAALDGGLYADSGGTWTSLGGPPDGVGVALGRGGVDVASATSGMWRLQGDRWSTLSSPGPISALSEAGVALAFDGSLLSLREGWGDDVLAEADGTVHLALSFHANFYHSYRGDSNDEDGYGKDIRVIGTILDWLDEHPEVRADWDIENHFTLDGWLATEAPELLARIQDRVSLGQDDVRLMSWNNGAMASHTWPEFAESITRARESYGNAFSRQTAGVQPQECMFTPDHIGWYRALGVDWITLFYSANGFTAMRQDVELEGAALYNPVTLRDAATAETITWMPVYHHADVLDHGGLRAWVKQIRQTVAGDTLLVIHFDADGESWENFDQELDDLDSLTGLDAVEFSTIEDYLDTHDPVAEVIFEGDVADGTGDGFQSWAEKDFNHEVATGIFAAREAAAQATFIDGASSEVMGLLVAAQEPHLLSLSTTHFGLAAPTLHEDRVASARAYVAEALGSSEAARDEAALYLGVVVGEVAVVNPRDSAGPALVSFLLPVGSDTQPDGSELAIYDEDGTELAVSIGSPGVEGLPVAVVLEVEAASVRRLTWGYTLEGERPGGGLLENDVPRPAMLRAPWVSCWGEVGEAGELDFGDAYSVDARGVIATELRSWDLGVCEASGRSTWSVSQVVGLPGTVVEVELELPSLDDPSGLEDIVPVGVSCGTTADTLSWRSFGGTWRTRPFRSGVDSWNGQSIDGQVSLGCSDGSAVQVAHDVSVRSSLAFAPARERDGEALIAPLGTLWGAGPWHDSRRTGGSGVGDTVTALVGSQFRPAGPDWNGREARLRLLVGEDLDPEVLDLFAHPPLAVVGQYMGAP